MQAFLNGRVVPESEAVVPVADRGLGLGDGLFETFRVMGGRLFRWDAHMARLKDGVQSLGFTLPHTASELRSAATQIIRESRVKNGILRLVLTRGTGPCGFSPKGATSPTVAMTLHPAPEVDPEAPPQWRLVTSQHTLRLNDPLSKFKTTSKIAHVMARAEAEIHSAQDALLLTTNREIACAAGANLFWFRNGVIFTPTPASGALPGITRSVVLEICQERNIPSKKILLRADLFRQSQGVFATSTTWGVVEIVGCDRYDLERSPLVQEISRAYWERVRRETTPSVIANLAPTAADLAPAATALAAAARLPEPNAPGARA